MRFLLFITCLSFAAFMLFFGQSMAEIVIPTKLNVELRHLTKEARQEVECLAQNIYFEAAHEPRQGHIAVAYVTYNRLKSGHFPSTYCSVVKQKTTQVCQFSWYCESKPRAIIDNRSLTTQNSALYNDIVDLALNFYLDPKQYKDPTKGALFYHADYVFPGWPNMKQTAYIGRHIFYNKTTLRNI